MKRALTYDNIVTQDFEVIPFQGEWQRAFGNPTFGKSWFIDGDSANGKSVLVMMLSKQFCSMGKRVLYDALEEYQTSSFKDRVILLNMAEVKSYFNVVREQPDELRERLKKTRKNRRPDVIILDSVQYLKVRKDKLFSLFDDYPEITWVVISQSEKGNPRGALAVDCQFEAYIKIHVDQYKAYFKGRAQVPAGGGVFDIYFEEAEKLGHQKSNTL